MNSGKTTRPTEWFAAYRVEKSVRLNRWSTDDTGGFEKYDARKRTQRILEELPDWQYRLYAEGRRSLLIVLQAMDAGGKDSVIRRVMSVLNPQGCRVVSFKTPTSVELAHDFLWRVHAHAPARGEIVVFNRSHYEDVLIARVRNLVPPTVWRRRYRHINEFERLLADEGTTILKFFLHISREEQRRRLVQRLKDPTKHWKVDPADLEERGRWPEYMTAYEKALSRCSTAYAPWYVVPADRKWFRDLLISSVILYTLRQMNPQFPPPKTDISKIRID